MCAGNRCAYSSTLQVTAPCRHIILFLRLQAGLQSGPNAAATLSNVKYRLRGILKQTQAADRVDFSLVENLKALQQFLQSDQQLSALGGSAALLRAQEELGSVIQQFQGDLDSEQGKEAWETGIQGLGRLAESLAMPGSLPNHTGGHQGGGTLLYLLRPHPFAWPPPPDWRGMCSLSPSGLAVSCSHRWHVAHNLHQTEGQCISTDAHFHPVVAARPWRLAADLLMPAGGLPASTSLQTALGDLLDSQHRLELAFQSASASQMQGSDTDTPATVAAASITQAAIQVGPSSISAWLFQCMAHRPCCVQMFRALPCR